MRKRKQNFKRNVSQKTKLLSLEQSETFFQKSLYVTAMKLALIRYYPKQDFPREMLRYLLPDSSKVTPQVENTFKISNLLYPHSAVAGRDRIWQHQTFFYITLSDKFLTMIVNHWLILSFTYILFHVYYMELL